MRRPGLLVLVLLVATGMPVAAQTPKGHLVIVGGGPRPRDISEVFLRHAGGPGARVLVLPLAAARPAQTGAASAADWTRMGANATSLVVTRANADADSVIAAIEAACGIWFPGGVQSRIMDAIDATRAERALRDAYVRGAGIDEATALVVRADGNWEVVGDGPVIIYDAGNAAVAPDAPGISGADLRMHVLRHGALFDPVTGQARLPVQQNPEAARKLPDQPAPSR